MILGTFNTLTIKRQSDHGLYLADDVGDEVLLPNKFVERDHRLDDTISVFVYLDSEDRPVATTQNPYIQLNEFAFLVVKDIANAGAFLDWGLDKDLLVPFREQQSRMKTGQGYIVYLKLDEKSNRLVGTTQINYYFDKDFSQLAENQEVDLLVGESHELGIEVVINNRYRGLLYENDIFDDLIIGDRTKGFIKKIRNDGKIDVTIRSTGLAYLEEGAERILNELRAHEGFLELTDKSSPEDIQRMLSMCKKNFKRSLGILYKKRLVILKENGIQLV